MYMTAHTRPPSIIVQLDEFISLSREGACAFLYSVVTSGLHGLCQEVLVNLQDL